MFEHAYGGERPPGPAGAPSEPRGAGLFLHRPLASTTASKSTPAAPSALLLASSTTPPGPSRALLCQQGARVGVTTPHKGPSPTLCR